MPAAKKSARAPQTTLVKQGAKFGLVGISNTLIDFAIYTAVPIIFHIPVNQVYLVKYLSGSVALLNSFYWNRRWVFPTKAGLGRTGVRFLLATIVSVYLIQPQVVRLFSATTFGQNVGTFWFNLAQTLGLVHLAPHILTQGFVTKTFAFAMGVLCAALWNFTLYRLWAFKND